MEDWTRRRASAERPTFLDDVVALGTDMVWLWDETCAGVEETLCGASRELLDTVYPPDRNGLRLALTNSFRGFPPVSIAFYLDDDDGENVVYVSVKLRAPAGPS